MSIAHIEIKSLEQLLHKREQMTNNHTLPVGVPDAVAYYFLKEATFLSRKEERWVFHLFQGLNTNPQNLSIYLRDEAQRQKGNGKQKLTKGVFVVYDLFSRWDVVIEINIPGNLRLYRVANGRKELLSNQEIDLMYLSGVFRSMYQTNLPWGCSYLLFHDAKNYLSQLRNFFSILFNMLSTRDINLGAQFESSAAVKGSHGCSLVLNYMKERKLVRHAVDCIEWLFQKHPNYAKCYKFGILAGELYFQLGRASLGLQLAMRLQKTQGRDPYLVYYQAKYLFHMSLLEPSLALANSIVQYNQFQIWVLLAQIHMGMGNATDTLLCLNHAVKQSKIKSHKNTDNIFSGFEELGKVKQIVGTEGMEHQPKILIGNENPLSILVRQVEEKNKFLLEKGFWRLNSNEKVIYRMLQQIRYKLSAKHFQTLLTQTFTDSPPPAKTTHIKKGIISQPPPHQNSNSPNSPLPAVSQDRGMKMQEEIEQLPDFLKNNSQIVEQSVTMKPNRNLSIIPEIESVIENSNYEEGERDEGSYKPKRVRREVQEVLFKLVGLVLGQSDFQKAQFDNNVAKILHVYNKMRSCSKFNNYYADQMFKIFVQTGNYRSIIVLIAQTLDFLEQKGVRKIDKLPYWMHKYLFFIIEERGLKFLNDMLEKLNFYDEAVIDTIQIAKDWKMKGVTY